MPISHPPRILIGVTFHTSLTFHEKLAEDLNKRGYDVHLVSSTGPHLLRLSDALKTHVLEMQRQPSLMQDVVSLFKWFQLIKKVSPDIVLVGTPKASLLGMIASSALRVKTRIYWVHGLRMETAQGFSRIVLLSLERLTAALSTSMYAVSHSLKKKLLNFKIGRADKIEIYGKGSTQGVDLKKYRSLESQREKRILREHLGLDTNKFTIGFVGRLTKEKGVEELRDALEAISKMRQDFQVIVLGSVEDQVGERLVNTLRASGIFVIAPGYVTNTAPYFQVMDLFCLPTYREGLPNVVLEAFASKVPVVSTFTTGIIDLISDKENGLLVPVNDSVALKNAIENIMNNPDLAATLGEQAFQIAEKYFSTDQVISNQIEYIESLLD